MSFSYQDGMISSIDFAGSVVLYNYDALRRMISVQYADGGQRSYGYEDPNFHDL